MIAKHKVKEIILYGAFDRYNYGDNLMPILMEMYLVRFHANAVKNYNISFASIKSSDLTKYECKKTLPITEFLNAEDGSVLIVVGGEVLSADVVGLFTHVQKNPLHAKLIRAGNKLFPQLIKNIAKQNYGAIWDYPYIPHINSFKNKVKVIYNTVGGIPYPSQKENITNAAYISSRDERTYNAVSSMVPTELVPDSVLMVSSLIDFDFLENHVRLEIKNLVKSKKIITVQACPYKVQFTYQEMARELDLIASTSDVQPVLLPIGYASGHDDVVFLQKVKDASFSGLAIYDDLSVWEIMYMIASSEAFYGTSLHGVITAMSFGVPHYCINHDIKKLVSFLKTWSIYPYNESIAVTDIASTLKYDHSSRRSELLNTVEESKKRIFESLNKISAIL